MKGSVHNGTAPSQTAGELEQQINLETSFDPLIERLINTIMRRALE